MAGRWNDEREEDYWNRERRYDVFGLNDEDEREREWRRGSEQRSFGRQDRSYDREDRSFRGEDRRHGREDRPFGREHRARGREDRVFGEREYGADYNRSSDEDWQSSSYGGVSPAMRRGDYGSGYRPNPRFQSQDYTRGGRYYGDDARNPIYREEYGLGGREYGPVPRGYDEAPRFGSRGADERWAREMRRPAPGGTGGYDYDRGYGDAGRPEDRREGRSEFEDRSREAGDFFRRTGQKISNWFSDLGRDENRDDRDERWRSEEHRGARGLGPKGYQRSDDRISDEVHQRLTEDPWLDASNINVSVSNGEVTLSGTVDNREAKHRAERIVEDLSGVRHVQNNVRIQAANYFTSAGRGYGDSVQEAQMRNDPVRDAAERSEGSSSDDAATRTTTRRT